ncbi:glycosyltransferase [Janthinobacterium lividum]|uniref:glycosyltransferase n=1 Tax=Janthinobacterium lividum TaxID=29581 RepID=UPI00142D3606|nr:glycosyltransferase [Janthinobacterium lividum]MCC7713026.1 glycosyltransferase [Janthinobacterium lividum]WQE31462.1 glycosyltransferase [Janthinobacterium lividum]
MLPRADLLAGQVATTPLVIVASSGTGGDMQPFIALAQGLQQRGRRVLLLVPGWQEAAAQASRLPYRTFGSEEEGQAMLGDPGLWDERKGWGVVWNGLVPHLGAVRDVVQGLPADEACVVLCHPILVPMAALARSARPDLRIVAAYLAPSNLCSSHDFLTAGSLRIPAWVPLAWRQALWRMIHRGMIDPVMLPGLNGARAARLAAGSAFFLHTCWPRRTRRSACFPRGSPPRRRTGRRTSRKPISPAPPCMALQRCHRSWNVFWTRASRPSCLRPVPGTSTRSAISASPSQSCGGWDGAACSSRPMRRNCRSACRPASCGRRTHRLRRYCRAWRPWCTMAASAPARTPSALVSRN